MDPFPIPLPEARNPPSISNPAPEWVRRVFRWPTLDSTNEAAFRALGSGLAGDGDAFVALEQTQGRGRRGNRWHSEPGLGLYASFIFSPECPFGGPKVTMAAGLASLDAVLTLGLTGARLKWPNDILVGPAKLAGVLVESRAWSADQPIYVLGVGINVGQLGFPGDLSAERPVVSLAQLGLSADLGMVEEALFASLGSRLRQARLAPDSLGRDFLCALALDPSPVEVHASSETVKGTIVGLEFDRGLELELVDGRRRWLPLEHIRSVAQAKARQG